MSDTDDITKTRCLTVFDYSDTRQCSVCIYTNQSITVLELGGED